VPELGENFDMSVIDAVGFWIEKASDSDLFAGINLDSGLVL